MNLLNLLNPMNLHTEGVSNGARCHRHLERSRMPLWETDRNRSRDALSREISYRNAARTMRGGRFLHSVETLHRVSKSAEVGL